MLCGYANMYEFNSYEVKSKYISRMLWTALLWFVSAVTENTETFDKHIQVLGILVQA